MGDVVQRAVVSAQTSRVSHEVPSLSSIRKLALNQLGTDRLEIS